MNTPEFRWTATDELEPNGRGAASLRSGDKMLVQSFASHADAMKVHEMMCAAQLYGLSCGQRAPAQLVSGTIHGYLRP